MMRMTTCLSIILIAGFATFKLIDMQVDTQLSWPNVVARDKQMREKSVNYFAFKHSFDGTLIALKNEEIHLAEAVEQVIGLARRYNTDYFVHLNLSELGDSEEERVANNLVGHIVSFKDITSVYPARLQKLEVELAEFLNESRIRQ